MHTFGTVVIQQQVVPAGPYDGVFGGEGASLTPIMA